MTDDQPGARAVPVKLELVGLAGVGKTHLRSKLIDCLAGAGVDLMAQPMATRDIWPLGQAFLQLAPLLQFLLLTSTRSIAIKLRYCGRLLHYGWREVAVQNTVLPPQLVISEEGWYHKLRTIRRLIRPDLAFLDLPPTVRNQLFRPDVVIFITADPMEICARKLRRKGMPVTDELLEWQYAQSAALGQWSEQDLTRKDLDQAVESHGQRVIVIDYGPDYDVERDLLPELRRMGCL